MADIAAVFHWPLTELEGMTLDDLSAWRRRAHARSGADQKGN